MSGLFFVLAALASFLLSSAVDPRVPLRQIDIEAASRRSDFTELSGVDNVPLLLDLLASMLGSGASLPRCMAHLATVCSADLAREVAGASTALSLGVEWSAAWSIASGNARVGPVFERSPALQLKPSLRLKKALSFAALTGAPSAALLRAEASRARRASRRELERRAAALGVKLVLPMGLCALPAFICLGVVPVLLALLPKL